MSHDKLVRMANQIAVFFATQPGSDQADRVAQHLRDYWDPRMRADLARLVADPASGLSPLAREAATRLDDQADEGRDGSATRATAVPTVG
jgi:formate dehydrogenase subunit delta